MCQKIEFLGTLKKQNAAIIPVFYPDMLLNDLEVVNVLLNVIPFFFSIICLWNKNVITY